MNGHKILFDWTIVAHSLWIACWGTRHLQMESELYTAISAILIFWSRSMQSWVLRGWSQNQKDLTFPFYFVVVYVSKLPCIVVDPMLILSCKYNPGLLTYILLLWPVTLKNILFLVDFIRKIEAQKDCDSYVSKSNNQGYLEYFLR